MENINDHLTDRLIRIALAEDIGNGDHTSRSTIPMQAQGKMQLLIKDDGILAGIRIAEKIFHTISPRLKMTVFIPDGATVKYGDTAFTVEGRVQSMLQAERLVLNVMQRMSGIATITRKYVDKLEGTKVRVLDTRKTMPGMRVLEKEAVRIGGGSNHRIGLFDMILLKDNHIDFSGGIKWAIFRANQYLHLNGKKMEVEIEVRNLDELNQVLAVEKVDRILLDNFSVEDTRRAVELVAGKYELESSGGITYETIREYALTGVDYISIGALTHSVRSLDMSLKFVATNILPL
ncbi:MAG: carboxylating nicotinate-nucleotide diphosphorylase [Dysgonamonadaceae bacterium]|jgi:nicotinate-nucleotide pyrophosphorylase (carboxylating)|nr:carboxylating nicotinate-nucleotide diphosphorylase [Dysgonamonadaceae bacterium]